MVEISFDRSTKSSSEIYTEMWTKKGKGHAFDNFLEMNNRETTKSEGRAGEKYIFFFVTKKKKKKKKKKSRGEERNGEIRTIYIPRGMRWTRFIAVYYLSRLAASRNNGSGRKLPLNTLGSVKPCNDARWCIALEGRRRKAERVVECYHVSRA